MSDWWYDMKFYSLKFMLEKYGQFSNKFGMLCIAREENVTGKRVYFIASLNKFLYHYPIMSNRHYYEIITDKSTIYFDLEYNRSDSFFINDEKGFTLFIELLKQFLLAKFPNIQANEIYYLTLDASNHKKFSRHVIVRLISKNTEYIHNNNFDALRALMLEFRDFIIGFVFGINYDASMYRNIDISNGKYLRKYQKNVDISEQDLCYDKFASEYSTKNAKEIVIFLADGLFIDYKVYDRNRNFRLMDSSKKNDESRILKFKPNLSVLPFKNLKSDNVLRFSFISKPFCSNRKFIRSDMKNNNADLNDTTIVAVKKASLLKFVPDELTIDQTLNLQKACKTIESLSFSITQISRVYHDIFCINVFERFCIIEKKLNRKNRVYFIYNINSSVIRFKCFDCGKSKFSDIPVSEL
ncbi:uncharacterized protein LOC116417824 isoform X1 [Nasonia vitripennis]|uniref:DNA-directed primase/polymerase protein n=1 Tax=Nasonia vitripennis TaxID=7425 RepID=A0A7M7TB84_NASVI|nr:uncharacterized protein LOC107981859 [Nasonia vitripennis]XP_031778779.1 uncharacterized protein LOC107981859 [Nasonia vitripennis]XP_031780900.1 uncharacterized protein LOC116416412 [Nasonia vitripennis]XP_031780902.1 uncharacterized protein LOC116416412 [Nasonia vitripennis]XP_031788784.1 uncharacterized protein LOC116417824 isoform X1 [Nasonia vitripennis]XP_031788785.1 uncharacterized protein LOC116417824 isoform X1 [Nasonia vitripennis]